MKTALYFIALMATVAQGDVRGTNPPSNICLCFSGNSVNIRSSACGGVIGSANSGQCFRFNGAKLSCTLSGRRVEFFQINWNGRNGWAAGTYLELASDSRCGGGSSGSIVSSGSTGVGEYTCEVRDSGKRIHETLSPTQFDCEDSSCRNTCKGGQCVAYVTCRCKRNGKWAPQTSCWRPGRKVKTSDGKCNRNIAANTAIATFDANGRYYYTGHGAVFIRCIDDRNVQVYDQYCGKSIGYTTYSSSHRFFSAFATITNPGCADRNSYSCRVENSGSSSCRASEPRC